MRTLRLLGVALLRRGLAQLGNVVHFALRSVGHGCKRALRTGALVLSVNDDPVPLENDGLVAFQRPTQQHLNLERKSGAKTHRTE